MQHPIRLCAIALVSGTMLLPQAARAFTMEDGKGFTAPKFNIEEQSRQFRTQDGGTAGTKNKFDTPLGPGTLQFGIRKDGMFGSPFNSSGARAQDDLRHKERMFAPLNSKDQYD
jgi:hypothetical protein